MCCIGEAFSVNICFLHRWFPPNGGNIGGIVPYLQAMTTALAAAGHHVFVFTEATPQTPVGLAQEGPLTVYRLPPSARAGSLAHLRVIGRELSRFVAQHRIEVVETCDWGAETLLFPARRHPGLRVALKLHCPLAVAHAALGRRPRLRGRWAVWIERQAIRQAHLVLSPSQICGEQARHHLRLPDLCFSVVPNPIDTAFWHPASVMPPRQRLLFVGRLERMKGVCRLAPLLDPLLARHPMLTLRFVGSDSCDAPGNRSVEAYLKQQVHPARRERLQFQGRTAPDELVSEYQQATACWFPSRFESFSLVCGEAMACGIPVIGSRTTAMTELIACGRSGFLVDFDHLEDVREKVDLLLGEPSLRDRLGRAAREKIEAYCSPQRVAACYEAVLAGGSGLQ